MKLCIFVKYLNNFKFYTFNLILALFWSYDIYTKKKKFFIVFMCNLFQLNLSVNICIRLYEKTYFQCLPIFMFAFFIQNLKRTNSFSSFIFPHIFVRCIKHSTLIKARQFKVVQIKFSKWVHKLGAA